MSHLTAVVLGLTVLASPGVAPASQVQAPAPAAAQPGGQKPKPAPTTPGEPLPDLLPSVPTPPRAPAQLTNIRIELTIADQRGAAPATGKTVSMLVADRFNGRVRTSGNVKIGNGFQPITLNVDAQPEILRDGRIRVQVSLEYRAHNAEAGPPDDAQPSTLSEQFSVILDDGKSMLITQSADPASDRKVRVEMKAVLVK